MYLADIGEHAEVVLSLLLSVCCHSISVNFILMLMYAVGVK